MNESITSLQNPRLKKALRLHTARGRNNQGRFIIFGSREIKRAHEAGINFIEIFLDPSSEIEDSHESLTATKWISSLLAGHPNPESSRPDIIELSSQLFSKLAYGDRVDGAIAIAARPETELTHLNLAENSIVLIAQAIEKPGNLGAILRSADAGGVDAVFLADPLTDFYHPNCIRSSTGTVFSQKLARGASSEIQMWLRENQFRVFTALLENATDFFDSDLSGNIAIVVGNEANGLDAAWQKPEFSSVKLPMQGNADSLNVSVTASIMIYEALRQRN